MPDVRDNERRTSQTDKSRTGRRELNCFLFFFWFCCLFVKNVQRKKMVAKSLKKTKTKKNINSNVGSQLCED